MPKKNSEGTPEKANNYNALKMMWDYLTTKYDFKRDVIKGRILWKEKDGREFKVLTDEKLNTFSLDLGLQGYKNSSPSNIQLFLFSEYTPEHNPVIEYLHKIATKNPSGAIDKLAETVTTTAPALWKKYLKKWLVASVANAMEIKGCQNHMCLTLTGGQGKGKTTWLENICPRELHPDYIFTGELDLGKKADTVWKLAEYWFINIEEQIKGLHRADANTMKHLITLPDIKGRRPYARIETQGRRIANFMASTNDEDFLTDHSGSRRYLCFKVMDIDLSFKKKVNMDEVWAEAFHLYSNKNYVYWIDSSDIEELQANNKEFASITQEFEYTTQYFTRPTNGIDATHLAPATVLRDFLRAETGNNNLKEKYIGMALKELGFEQGTHRLNGGHPIKAWKVKLVAGTANANFNKYSV